jgi:hypothetical protein
VRLEFSYDGGGLGKGGTVSLYSTARRQARGRIDRTQPIVFSLDDKTDRQRPPDAGQPRL